MVTDALKLLLQIGGEFTFQERAIPIPPDMRSDYRMAVIVLMLHYCGGRLKQAPLAKLHVLNWSMRTSTSRRAFLDRLDGKLHMRDVPLKFDPAFSRAIDLACAEKLIDRTTSHALALSSQGVAWVLELLAAPSCLNEEKSFLESVGKRFTNSALNSILKPSPIW
jgi:hypothetical protein